MDQEKIKNDGVCNLLRNNIIQGKSSREFFRYTKEDVEYQCFLKDCQNKEEPELD